MLLAWLFSLNHRLATLFKAKLKNGRLSRQDLAKFDTANGAAVPGVYLIGCVVSEEALRFSRRPRRQVMADTC